MAGMNLRPVIRITFVAPLAAASLAFASGPDNQYGYKTPIVRIATGNQFQGTGTIIENHRVVDPNGDAQGYFCVLTADHVISTGVNGNVLGNLSVGFGNLHDFSQGPFPNGGNYMPNARVVGRKGIDAMHPNEMVDMALLLVPYGKYDPTYDGYVMALSPVDAKPGDLFSSAGYGNQGARLIEAAPRAGGILQPDGKWWNGYKGTGTYEEQRSYYNSVNAVFPKSDWTDPAGGTYKPYDPSDPYAPPYDVRPATTTSRWCTTVRHRPHATRWSTRGSVSTATPERLTWLGTASRTSSWAFTPTGSTRTKPDA